MILKNKITDPLKELLLSGNENLTSFQKLNELLKINHHSPTSANMPLGIYVFRYLKSTQQQRREFEGNANMMSGVVCGDALADHYSNKIW